MSNTHDNSNTAVAAAASISFDHATTAAAFQAIAQLMSFSWRTMVEGVVFQNDLWAFTLLKLGENYQIPPSH